jgi:dUTP pyrophosphatase
MPLLYAKLNPQAKDPVRKHPNDAGVDVFSLISTLILPFRSKIIPTGLTFEIPPGYMLDARPKGRNNHLIGAGIIDAGYQGEILIKVVNYEYRPLWIKKWDAIAQLVLVKIETPPLEKVDVMKIHEQVSERGGTGGIVDQVKK